MLIILYGDISNKSNWKQQRMIDGGSTCGYREYARNFGHIIYLCPQKIKLPWEHSIVKPKNVIKFINKYPDAVVWSVKHSPQKDNQILSKIKNKKIYYSCNAKNCYNQYCDVSLVDTEKRIRQNAKIFFKGKDPERWGNFNNIERKFDYLLMGTRGDKNEAYFINNLTNKIKDERSIIWIGGEKFKNRIKSSHHKIMLTKFIGEDDVRKKLVLGKVGVIFTELQVEGFPQSFLEFTMSGLITIYNINAPRNKFYFHKGNCVLCEKKNLIETSEKLLKNVNNNDNDKCRKIAIENYSIEKSYKHIISLLE